MQGGHAGPGEVVVDVASPAVHHEPCHLAIREEETRVCGDTGTTRENLVEAHRFLFRNPSVRYVNVCGSRIWPSEEWTWVSRLACWL